jgi:hypothetical protein
VASVHPESLLAAGSKGHDVSPAKSSGFSRRSTGLAFDVSFDFVAAACFFFLGGRL